MGMWRYGAVTAVPGQTNAIEQFPQRQPDCKYPLTASGRHVTEGQETSQTRSKPQYIHVGGDETNCDVIDSQFACLINDIAVCRLRCCRYDYVYALTEVWNYMDMHHGCTVQIQTVIPLTFPLSLYQYITTHSACTGNDRLPIRCNFTDYDTVRDDASCTVWRHIELW